MAMSTHQRIRREMAEKRKNKDLYQAPPRDNPEGDDSSPNIDTMNKPEATAFAAEHDIDITGLTKIGEIRAAIKGTLALRDNPLPHDIPKTEDPPPKDETPGGAGDNVTDPGTS